MSQPDFHNKLGIATKESAETEFWLELIDESEHLQTEGTLGLLKESGELIAILTTIAKNSKLSSKAK